MNPVPTQLVEGLSDADVQIAHEWWNLLAEEQQAELSTLYDSRQDSCRVKSKQITILVDSELLRVTTRLTRMTWLTSLSTCWITRRSSLPTCHSTALLSSDVSPARHGVHLVVEAASTGFMCPFNSKVCPFRR